MERYDKLGVSGSEDSQSARASRAGYPIVDTVCETILAAR